MTLFAGGGTGDKIRNGRDRHRRLSAPLADFEDSRSRDRQEIGMAEFEVHAPANELFLEHGTTPGGAMNLHEHGAWTILGVTRDERIAATLIDDGIPPLAGLHF